MSCYYTYYIGYMHEEKIYPLGPYNSFGNLMNVLSRSRSYASDMGNHFWEMSNEYVSEELRKEFESENWKGEKVVNLYWEYLDNLPNGDFVKNGYFLIKDVEAYEKEHDALDLFYERLSPQVFAAKMLNEAKFGKTDTQYDEEGNPFENHSVSEYMFYAYPDYYCEEYEAYLIRRFAESLVGYHQLPEGSRVVVLCSIG